MALKLALFSSHSLRRQWKNSRCRSLCSAFKSSKVELTNTRYVRVAVGIRRTQEHFRHGVRGFGGDQEAKDKAVTLIPRRSNWTTWPVEVPTTPCPSFEVKATERARGNTRGPGGGPSQVPAFFRFTLPATRSRLIPHTEKRILHEPRISSVVRPNGTTQEHALIIFEPLPRSDQNLPAYYDTSYLMGVSYRSRPSSRNGLNRIALWQCGQIESKRQLSHASFGRAKQGDSSPGTSETCVTSLIVSTMA